MTFEMEILIYAIITAVWWISSFTFLFPLVLLLKFSKSFQNWFFALIFSKILKPLCGPLLRPHRLKAFDLLKQELNQDERRVKQPVKVLEIGIGEGGNLDLYPENIELTALDVNESFKSFLSASQKKYPHIDFQKLITNSAENMKDVADSEFDVVVSTYVLCSVNSVPDVIKEVQRVLKPGGKFVFLDHVGYPSNKMALAVQLFANPIWRLYFGGCNLHRNIIKDISAVFSNVTFEYGMAPIFLFVRPQLFGLATK